MEFVLTGVAVVLGGGIAFAIVVLATGKDPGLVSPNPDTVSTSLPPDRPLSESDVYRTRFDTGLRGYRTAQVDEALARVAYDVGFKDELIKVFANEVEALRDGRSQEAETFRKARERAMGEAEPTEDLAAEGAPPVPEEVTNTPDEGAHARDDGDGEAPAEPRE